MLPYMPLVCLVAVGGAALQTHGRFGPTAGSPILLNLLMIAAMLGLYPLVVAGTIDPATHLRVLAIAVVAAGLLQLAWTYAALRPLGLAFSPRDPSARELVRSTLLGVGPLMLGLGVLQVNIVVDGLIASWPSIVGPTIMGLDYPLEEGAMTALTNAARLYEFPLGVFGIAIATAIFPALARQNNDAAAFMATLRRGLRLSMFIGLPASAGLMLVSRESVGVLFQRGAFGPDDTARVAFVLLGFAPAIWAYQLNHILTRAFYARKEPFTPVKVAVSMVGLNLALNIALIFTPLREAGLACSTSVCAVVQAAILSRLLSRELAGGPEGGLLDAATLRSVGRTVLATAAMALSVLAAGALAPDGATVGEMAVSLAAKVGVGAVVYLAISRVFLPEELRGALGRRAS